MTTVPGAQTFWDHLDELRAAVVRTVAVALAFAVAAFCFKETLFAAVLAPKDAGFVTYRLLSSAGHLLSAPGVEDFSVRLINTGLADQFLLHVRVAAAAGLLFASPYALYQLFRFVSPALYADERRYAVRVVGWGYVLFLLGVLTGYFLLFPLTFRFLGMYQVSGEVTNLINLQSYISTLLSMCLSLGIVFEIPVLTWLFAKLGFLTPAFLRRYRRHALVVILLVAAIITPTSDVFTLALVSLPMWLLYEVSIFLIRRQG